MEPTQDPKYGIELGGICNIETGVPIPLDEPVFILRAKDILAEQTLQFYESMVAAREHAEAVHVRVNEFRNFRHEHPDRMKAPTTVFPYPVIKPL